MNKKALILLLLSFNVTALLAQPNSDKVLKEGQLLFRLEKASWYGTDEFLSKFPEKRDRIGGYLSYEGEDGFIYNLFFDRNNQNEIIARFQFDNLPLSTPRFIDTLNHVPTQIEKDLITIRQDAVEKVNSNADRFFSFYDNTSYNFIPIITEKERIVYIITGPQTSGIVIIGNDYLLKYNSENKFISKEKIHNSLIPISAKMDTENQAIATMHSHVISEIIDPTDICTLLLYKDFVEWKKHYVISKKYVSIFDMEREELLIMKRKDWEKIVKSQNK